MIFVSLTVKFFKNKIIGMKNLFEIYSAKCDLIKISPDFNFKKNLYNFTSGNYSF